MRVFPYFLHYYIGKIRYYLHVGMAYAEIVFELCSTIVLTVSFFLNEKLWRQKMPALLAFVNNQCAVF